MDILGVKLETLFSLEKETAESLEKADGIVEKTTDANITDIITTYHKLVSEVSEERVQNE